MSKTIKTVVADGVTAIFTFEFEYISSSFVKVYVDGTAVSFTLTGTYQVTLDETPASGAFVVIRRETTTDKLVNFVDGSVLIASDLNISTLQATHIAEEASDRASNALSVGINGEFTAEDRRITSVSNPVDPQDVVTKGWIETELNSVLVEAEEARDTILNIEPAMSRETRAGLISFVLSADFTSLAENSVLMVDGLAYVKATGASVIPDLPNVVPYGKDASLKHFGAKGDCVTTDTGYYQSGTDDTAAVQAAFNWVVSGEGRSLYGSGHKYYIAGEIAATGSVRVRDFWLIEGVDARAVDVEPVLYGPFVLGADYSLGSLSINLVGAPLPFVPRPGMKMKIVSDALDPWNRDTGASSEAYRQGEWFTVGIGSTTTNVVLFRPLQFTRAVDPTSTVGEELVVANGYTTAYGARVVFADHDAVCDFENITVQYVEGHAETPWTQPALYFAGYHKPSIRGCGVVRGYGPAISLQGTIHARVDRLSAEHLTNDTSQGQYGYVVRNAGYGTTVDGVVAKHSRHAFTSAANSEQAGEMNPKALLGVGRIQGEKVVNGYAYGSENAHWDTHHGTHGAIFDDCHSYNGNTWSVAVRGRDILVKNHISRNMKQGVYAFTEYHSGQPEDDFGPNEKSKDTATRAIFSDLDIQCDFDPLRCSHADLQVAGTCNYITKDHRALQCDGGSMTVLGRQTFIATSADYSTDNTGILNLTGVSSYMAEAFSKSHIIIGDGAEVTIDAKDATGVVGMHLFTGEAGTKVTIRGRLRVVLPQDVAGLFSGDVEVVCEGGGYIEYSVDNVSDDSVLVTAADLDGRKINIRTVDGTLRWDGAGKDAAINVNTPGLIRLDWAPDGVAHGHHFGVSEFNTPAQNDAAIATMLEYCGNRRAPVLNKVGSGTVARLGDGVFQISDEVRLKYPSVVLEGLARNITVLRQMDETKMGVVMAGVDPFNTGNADPIGARPENVGVRRMGIYCDQNDHTDALAFIPVVMRRTAGFASELNIRGYHTGILLSGVSEGTKVLDIYGSSSRGSGVTSRFTNDAHIVVALEPCDPLDALARVGGDGNYYVRPVGTYVSECQFKDPAGKMGVYDALRVDGIDGLYLTNNHLGFGARSQICFDAPTAIGTLNVAGSNLFLDSGADTPAGPSDYSILAMDSSGLGAALNNTNLTGIRMNTGEVSMVDLDRPGLNGFRLSDFAGNNAYVVSGQDGLRVRHGKRISFSDGTIGSCPGGFYVLVDNAADISDVEFSNLRGSDESGVGAAQEGMRVNLAPQGLKVSDCDFRDCNNLPLVVKGGAGSSTDWSVSKSRSGASASVASASTIYLPAWAENVVITGTTDINHIGSNATTQSAWEGRTVTMFFDGILTVDPAGTGNVNLRTPFTTAAGSTLTLEYLEGAWREVNRQA